MATHQNLQLCNKYMATVIFSKYMEESTCMDYMMPYVSSLPPHIRKKSLFINHLKNIKPYFYFINENRIQEIVQTLTTSCGKIILLGQAARRKRK